MSLISKKHLGYWFLMVCFCANYAQAAAQYEVIHSFGGPNDGYGPIGGLVIDKSGNLWGTTVYGGPTEAGSIFEIAQDGTLLNSQYWNGGGNFYGGVTLDKVGNVYGTFFSDAFSGFGAAFEIDAHLDAVVWQHNFNGGSSDGASPYAGLIEDRDGNAYGTTVYGGPNNLGTVVKFAPDGTDTILHSFNGICCGQGDGSFPYGGLVRDAHGNLFGTTGAGGNSSDMGTVFEISKKLAYTVLHTFSGGNDGANPESGLILDSGGNLYGTTVHGGPDGLGTVFKIAPNGTETVLYAFKGICCGQNDGAFPYGGLVADTNGNLYGTTQDGGSSSNLGTVFKISPDGTETVLHAFAGGADGSRPHDTLTYRKGSGAGTLWGDTSTGGATDGGTVFRLKLK